MKRLARLAIAGLTAVSLTLIPISASARPDSEDVAKTLAGLALLGFIASRANSSSSSRTTSTQSSISSAPVIDGTFVDQTARKKRPGYKQLTLPSQCRRIVRTSRGDRLVYGQRCLERSFNYARNLPNSCERLVRTDRGLRTVYGARCLRNDGWTLAAR